MCLAELAALNRLGKRHVVVGRRTTDDRYIYPSASSESSIFSTNAGWMNPAMLNAVSLIEAE